MDRQKLYKRITKYKKKAMKRIALEVQKDYFAAIMEPAIKAAGATTNGFIKQAIAEKIGISDAEAGAIIAEYRKQKEREPAQETDEENPVSE